MLEYNSGSLGSGIAGLILVVLLTIPSALSIFSESWKPKADFAVYQDKDGAATKDSAEKYSAKIPKFFIAGFTLIGLSFSTVLAVLGVLRDDDGMKIENWINAAQWYLLAGQSAGILRIRDYVQCFTLGIYAALSSISLLAVLLYQDVILAQQSSGFHPSHSNHVALRTSQLISAVLLIVACMSMPRRPDVFHDGTIVDRMYTESALSRYSFAWVEHLLKLARKKNRLEQEDLPKMDHHTRSKELSEGWIERKRTKKLWVEVFLAHKSPIMVQWLLTLFQAFGNLAPQYVTFKLLELLERRIPGQSVGPEAWFWVVALTLVSIGASCNESWLFWISWAEIAIPVRSQLSALIFQKAMRRKDVKGASNSGKKGAGDQSDTSGSSVDEVAADKPDTVDTEDSDPKGRQSTINLIGVDTKRVSDFCSFNNYFPGSIFKLAVSFGFLISIIGWKALLAGFLAMSLTIPLNIYCSKLYSDAQDRLMKVRDVKMGVVTEALQGIRQIKFCALERNWYDKIDKVRSKELKEQWDVYVSDTFLLFCWITSPIALSATSLAVYAYIYGTLTPSVAFTAIGVFNGLEVTLSVIPELTTDLIDAWVSVERIEKYLNAPEIAKNTSNSPNISFEKASIAWPSDEEEEDTDLRYVLRNVNVSFPNNELSVVSGKTGTGKSLLLAAILGEVDLLSGKISVPRPPPTEDRHDHLANKENWIIPSSVAFVAQIPWIENATIKENILFGLPFVEDRYQKVIEVCALTKDLDMLADGENTEIGANGINLSGGQRWRVTFARALYSRAGILVLDDIFSAVDAHVGRYIFENALTGSLGTGRTRILVTHHVALCKSKTKYIVELGDGTVENAGLVEELEEDGKLQQIINHEETAEQIRDEVDPDWTAVNSITSSEEETVEGLKRIDSKKPKVFVEEEKREQGRVKWKIYAEYMNASGGWVFWTIAFTLFGIVQFLSTGRSWWLKLWTSNDERHVDINHTLAYSLQMHNLFPWNATTDVSPKSSTEDLHYYLSIYLAFSVLGAIIGTLRYFYIYTGSIRASRRLFERLSFTILRTPLRWMDTVPLGRILNRFTTDFNVVDSRLSNDIAFGGYHVFRLIGTVIAGTVVSPYVLVVSVLLFGICIYITRLYLTGAREVKRLESSAKSPVFEQFGSALTGVGTIRAFDKSDVYITRMFSKIDNHSTSFWHLWAFNRWMGWRMSIVGAFFSTIVASMILLIVDMDASLAGFALSFALEYGQALIWMIRNYTNMELNMNAAERIIEYSNIDTESLDGADPPAAWPTEGKLEVNELVVGYAPDLPAVLKGLTFSVARNERIGVVGRTGAGKSSLTLALFRFLEPREGSIHIDGLDISKIKLQALRSRLAIIPQDPVLFSGTVRSNLDAFDEHEDSELRDALQRAHLINALEAEAMTASGISTPSSSLGTNTPSSSLNKNNNPFASLSSSITEGGLNLSQGQRQLLCLARAIVSRPKIMILDEATSAVDMSTDTLIQRSIREEFGDATLIVIAHRLSTIADFDKILVLEDGKVAEFGTPKELWERSAGVFKGMVEDSGESEKLVSIIESTE